MKIVDEFTGRILEGRRWSEGLHQAVEAKEGVKIKEENQTLATITLQNYFRLYDKLAGMTGTALTEAAEFASTYDLEVVPIPTNQPMIRLDQGDLIYKTEDAKFEAVRRRPRRALRDGPARPRRHGLGREVRAAVAPARQAGHPHEVLNAKQHAREAEIVAQAGRLPSVTVATNMAGRGVDIILGGNPEGLARELQAEGLEPRHRGVRGPLPRAGPVEDESKAEGDKVRERRRPLRARHRAPREPPHRQPAPGPVRPPGRPGESRFYLSLEDELMRLFATGAMSWVMGKALPDDVPIEARMVTKAIERAQNTVEARNAEIRKNVLKYDEVMNEQRKVIYRRRNQILDGADLRDEAIEYLARRRRRRPSAPTASRTFPEEWDLDGLVAEVSDFWPTDFTAEDLKAERHRRARTTPHGRGGRHYEQREAELGADTMREVERQVMLRSSTSGGASTSTRWTTSRRASTSGPWARRTRSSSGSARATRCSRR